MVILLLRPPECPWRQEAILIKILRPLLIPIYSRIRELGYRIQFMVFSDLSQLSG